MKHLRNIVQLLICLVVLAVAAIQHSGRLFGVDLRQPTKAQTDAVQVADTLRIAGDTVVVNTSVLAGDVKGYAGPVPLEVRLVGGKIQSVVALDNVETPDFFHAASELLTVWDGLTPEEALEKKVDAVSGATFSSRAIIANAQSGMEYLVANPAKVEQPHQWNPLSALSWASLAGLLVAMLAAVVPLLTKNKLVRTLQLLLNVAVLGLWSGTFLSYSALLSLFENGWRGWLSLLPLLLVVMAFVYPLFGKKQYYCTHVCPYGSLQELTGRLNKRKWQLGQRWTKRLTLFREVLWAVLTLLMLAGVWFQWMDYELFTAFIFRSASVVVIVFAVLFVVLSLFVARPYCRFVCPTGTLFKMSETNQ